MKTHAIIPIFIPHLGCPHTCIFCNQNTITGAFPMINRDEVHRIIDEKLSYLKPRQLETIEVAFFGGSFTGIPVEQQKTLLEAVLPYKHSGEIDLIRISTRPDYIHGSILKLLRDYTVDIIELGVQSFDDQVLMRSERGHNAEQIESACHMIRHSGFQLGIQLMIGLPGDDREKALYSVAKAVAMKPDFVRIYPTVVLAGTQLAQQYIQGTYTPPSTEEAVCIAKSMVRIFDEAGIPVIRLGLKNTEFVCTKTDLSGTYHPAFRQLVEGALALDDMETQLESAELLHGEVVFHANPTSFSNLIGHKGVNKRLLTSKYPNLRFVFKNDSKIPPRSYVLKESHQ